MHARFVSLQPLQHLDPTAHPGDVHSCHGAGLRARRPHRARGVAGSLKAAVFDPKEFIASLPRRPGVYRMFGAARELLYVGKARSLKDRVGTYFAAGNVHPKVQALTAQIDAIEVTVTNSETEALLLEYNLIKAHKPRFNVVLRDDKSFPYIQLCVEHQFPRLMFYRGARRGAGRYFGPFPNAGAVRDTLNQLQKLFRIRNCRDSFFANRSRPCLQHQIGRCSAPCVRLITPEAYAQDIDAAVKVLEGRSDEVNAQLQTRMEQAASRLDFERAAQIRDQLAALKRIQAQQVVTAEGHRDVDVFAIVGEAGEYAVSVMLVRGGRNLGTTSYFPRAALAEAGEALASFVMQYYASAEAPAQVLLGTPLEEAASLAELLSSRTGHAEEVRHPLRDRKSTRLNSSHGYISYAVFCLKKKKTDAAPSRRIYLNIALPYT